MLILKKGNLFRKSINVKAKFFSSDTIEIPTIDFDKFLNRREGWQQECRLVADCLNETGVLVVKDPVIKY